jgi:DNA invertase Pin-like site-specific DNA recombinase
MNENKEKRVALYIRVANADQLSADFQTDKLHLYAREQGITDVELYVDNGYSGRSFKRPALNQMQIDISKGEVGKVIATDVSRISRDTMRIRRWMDDLKKRGIKFDTMDKSHELVENKIIDAIILASKKPRNRDRESR